MRAHAHRWSLLLAAAVLSGSDGFGQTPVPTQPSSGSAIAADGAQPSSGTGPSASALSELAVWVSEHKGQLSARAIELGPAGTKTLWASNPDLPLNPASTMKLVTAAAALDLLGGDYAFETGIYGEIVDGKAQRLVLRGHGDPSLLESDLWRLVNSLVNQGLSEVSAVLVDQSAFDEQWIPPGFEQQPKEWAAFRAPISAIALEANSVTLNVAPGVDGNPARVWLEPTGVATLDGTIATGKRGSGDRVQLELVQRGERLLAHVGGAIAEGLGRQRYSRRVEDPRLIPGWNLKALLEQRGVKVGSVSLGGSDVKARLTFTQSQPLSELLRSLGKWSDNFYAETLFKSLGRTSPAPATSAAAAQRVLAWLAEREALPPGTRIQNGSGLFDSNRLAASTLTRVLELGWTNPRLMPEYTAQFAIGGTDGTLRNRFARWKDSHSVRAKTGTLDDVIALAGYLMREQRAPIAFAIEVNGIRGQHAELRNRIDAIVDKLAKE